MDYKEMFHVLQVNDDAELVQKLYDIFDEDTRLNKSKAARVEFITTTRIVEQYMQPGARILDIGAGAGEYSLYFARKGYDVSALELAESNIKAFRKKVTAEDYVDLIQGNALDLSRYEDHSFDAVLLFGPLYHLHELKDRKQCVREAKRVCKENGVIFVAFIANDFIFLTELIKRPDYFLKGDYDKKTFRLDDVPFVFHTPDACRELLRDSGLTILREVASDGASELLAEYINGMDEESYAQYLRYHEYICEKPEMLGMSNHLLYVCKA